jgi:hypothetical protein
MKVVSKLFLILVITACSVFKGRSPSSSDILNYEKGGLNYVELNVELTSLRPRISIPRFTINSTDHDLQKADLRLIHEDTVSCTLSEKENSNSICSLIRGSKGKLKILYSFNSFKTFPVYEVDWASNEIKRQFSKNDILKSKLNRKIKHNHDLNSLFLNEKITLLEILGKKQTTKINFPKRRMLKLDENILDVILIKNMTSELKHKSKGRIPINGIEINKFSDEKFEKNNLNAYEFFCETKHESHFIEGNTILVEDHNDKVKCQFNDRVRGVFGRYYTRGAIHFDIVSIDLDEAVKELQRSEKVNNQKLKSIVEKINDSNINTVYNGLSKLRSIYGL